MKIGVSAMFGNSPFRGMPFVRDYAVAAEALGFASLWVPEHIVFFGSYKSTYPYKQSGNVPWSAERDPAVFDPLLVIAAASAVAKRLRFGTTVLVVPERPALLMAKEIMTLDHLTGGRYDFGVGLGWSEEEYRALGVTWEGRGQRFDEYLEAFKLVWTKDRASFHGKFLHFDDVILKPFPITAGGPPIYVGGNSAPAMRRAARFGHGWYGVWMGFDELEPQLEALRHELDAVGREVGDFRVKLNLPVPPDYPVDEVMRKVRECRRLRIDEFVIELPIRSRQLEQDLRHWAELLDVKPT